VLHEELGRVAVRRIERDAEAPVDVQPQLADLERLSNNFLVTGQSKLTVRQWRKDKPYEFQKEFGEKAIENIKKWVW
jgi:hypothetical protein